MIAASACSAGLERDELRISAAASLTDVFTAIGARYEQVNPGVDVVLNFAGSSTLAEQILQGAPADVFASADVSQMELVAEQGAATGIPTIFATNTMQIAVPAGNPGDVTGLDDFARPELFVGVCAIGVPCGDLARAVLANAGVHASIDSEEPNVRALLTKIELAELDAGITYATDVASSDGSVEGIDIPLGENVTTGYPIAAVDGHSQHAAEFIDFVLSGAGREILTDYGFGTP